MDIGRVKGRVVSTVRSGAMSGDSPLLLVELASGTSEVAADTVSARVGDEVLVSHGTAARHAIGDLSSTVDAAVTAIVDAIDTDIEA